MIYTYFAYILIFWYVCFYHKMRVSKSILHFDLWSNNYLLNFITHIYILIYILIQRVFWAMWVWDENKTAILSVKCVVKTRVIILKLPSDVPFDLSFIKRYELSIIQHHSLIMHASLLETSFSYFRNLLCGALRRKDERQRKKKAITDLFLGLTSIFVSILLRSRYATCTFVLSSKDSLTDRNKIQWREIIFRSDITCN